ncbi:MAG: hypothetical protein M3083_12440 [Actinomycetota bacterium]|nr:hypothetical protein [Actinomycetota bacterium]
MVGLPPNCTGLAAFTSTVPVNSGAATYTSAPFKPTLPGIYRWVALYSGDANNASATTNCGDAGETATIAKATTMIVTTASAPTNIGGTISDSAVLSGGFTPTGTLIFNVYGPNDPTCTGAVAFPASIVTVNGNATYNSGPFGPTTKPGTYNFVVSYSGDASNAPFTSTCGASGESTTVNKLSPTIVTTASGPVMVGSTISDSAVLAGGGTGGLAPTGTITFNVFGPQVPGPPNCAGAPAFTSTATVAGNGTYSSAMFTATLAGTYQFVASYSGDANNNAVTSACGAPNESVVVSQAHPTLVTTASSTTAAGGQISDTAVLAGGLAPTGTITFSLFGPNNPMCMGVAIFTAMVTVNGNASYPSGPFPVTAPGTYNWVAVYSGDANNAGVTSACGAANESVTVTKANPAIVTVASASVPAGGTISDTAALSNGVSPTGTILFSLFGPNNAGCAGAAIFTSAKTVNGNGSYTSDPFTTSLVGTYRFIAAYSGDANNNAVTTACGDPNESVNVTPALPKIITQASPPVPAGGPISDTATLSNGVSPTGTIVFTLFGPNNATCMGIPIFTSGVTVNAGNGNYPSGNFTTMAAGTYRWIAAYSGDANNAAVTTMCNDANENVVVPPATPKIMTQVAAATAVLGGTISDTATLSNGSSPKGTITFNVFGPNDATCANAPIFTSMTAVNGNGPYSSGTFTPTAPGTYRFVAAYSGDANNVAVATLCNDANESVVVGKTTPMIVTTASGTVPAGGAISDTATLSGGVAPTGTIVFSLFGPNDAACTKTAIFTSIKTVAGNGSYPSDPFTTAAVGTYRWIAAYSGDANNAAVTTACNDPNESVTVTKAPPGIVTQASGPVTLGATVSDTATLSGGTGPTGTITFTVFGPNNAGCAGVAAFTATVTVSGNGSYPSGPFMPTAPGTYRFVAVYSGDANNLAAGPTLCADPAEAVVVSPGNPTILTHTSAPVTVGGTVTDTATLAGGVSPTGTITFQAFGPNTTCAGIPAFTSTKTVAGNGNYTSDPFTVPAAGTYRFVATYSGDANNSPAGPTACADANEVTAGNKANPAIATMASAPVALGAAITDTAILTGGFNPTGTITFNLFGPNNTTCAGAAVFTAMVTVNGTGNYTTAPFTPTAPGNYTFVASYSGDANNNPAGPTLCNDPAETVPVTPSAITLSTTASPSVDVGQAVFDTATLGGSGHPTGTITFNLFGPNNPTCAGAPAFTSIKTVNGTGNYVSDSFIPTAPGSYVFVAAYSGDANNVPAGPTPCSDPAEVVSVLPTPQIMVTKAADPLTRPEPGGSFTFTVQVSNPSTVDPVKITSLFDNIYGDLATRVGSTCGSLIGVTLPPLATSPKCTFPGPFTGRGGDSQTDTVTVTGVDSHGVMVSATAQATVTLTAVLPSIAVTKTADPLTKLEPGGIFTFTAQVFNNNTVEPIKITSLVDNIYGDLATRSGSTCGSLIGLTLPAGGASPKCTFPGAFNGKGGDSQTDTVTVTGVDTFGNTATASANATVSLTSLTPVIAVTKAANPLTLPEPGGTFTFTVQVSNPSTTDPIKITSLVDNVYGDLATRSGSTCGSLIGVILPAGGISKPCTFTGPFMGKGGDSQTDIVTVKGVDSFGNTATATAQATVTLTTALPQIKVTKAASPLSLPAPTGTFTFTVTVTNPGTVPVKITMLVDNIYGDLATRVGSTCGTLIGTTLDPGKTSTPCTFTGPFSGKAGDSQTDIVTVTGVDTNGHTVTATAQATVTLTTAPTPMLTVTKTANPLTLAQPGGTFTFTVTVTNPSPNDPVKITSLVDNIYGDLATRPGSTCGTLIGVTLAPGQTSQPCTFTGAFNGVGGASQTDIVTAMGKDTAGTSVTATARATVGITAPPPAPPLALTGFGDHRPLALAAGLLLGGLLLLVLSGTRRRYQ